MTKYTHSDLKPASFYPNKSALSKQVGGSHYKNLAIQPTEFNYCNNIPFIEGNIIKYVTRWKTKGNGIEDLRKAMHYLEMLIEFEEKKVHSEEDSPTQFESK